MKEHKTTLHMHTYTYINYCILLCSSEKEMYYIPKWSGSFVCQLKLRARYFSTVMLVSYFELLEIYTSYIHVTQTKTNKFVATRSRGIFNHSALFRNSIFTVSKCVSGFFLGIKRRNCHLYTYGVQESIFSVWGCGTIGTWIFFCNARHGNFSKLINWTNSQPPTLSKPNLIELNTNKKVRKILLSLELHLSKQGTSDLGLLPFSPDRG